MSKFNELCESYASWHKLISEYREEAIQAAVAFRKALDAYLEVPKDFLHFVPPPNEAGIQENMPVNVYTSSYPSEDRLGWRFTLALSLEMAPETHPRRVIPLRFEYSKAKLTDVNATFRIGEVTISLVDYQPETFEPAFEDVVTRIRLGFETAISPEGGEGDKAAAN